MATSLSIGPTSKLSVPNTSSPNVIKVGVIGYGYWGPNIVRNFHGQERSRVVSVCDKSPKSLKRVQQSYPDMHATRRLPTNCSHRHGH